MHKNIQIKNNKGKVISNVIAYQINEKKYEETKVSTEERILSELQYQTMLLEMNNGGE